MKSDKRPNLKIDWATHEAAKYACENWHYSRSVPKSKLVKIGVWENNRFSGVVIFSPGATPEIGSPFGLKQTEICELTRIALRQHETPVSKIGAVALRFLKKSNPGLRLVISYADLEQNHHGGIYQAMNWIYLGRTKPDCYLKVGGRIEHRKTIYDRYGCQSLSWLKANVDPMAERIPDKGKHKYAYPLDDELKVKLTNIRKPYPKRVTSVESGTSADQAERGGESPTVTLQDAYSSLKAERIDEKTLPKERKSAESGRKTKNRDKSARV